MLFLMGALVMWAGYPLVLDLLPSFRLRARDMDGIGGFWRRNHVDCLFSGVVFQPSNDSLDWSVSKFGSPRRSMLTVERDEVDGQWCVSRSI